MVAVILEECQEQTYLTSTNNVKSLFGMYQRMYGKCIGRHKHQDNRPIRAAWKFTRKVLYQDAIDKSDTYNKVTIVLLADSPASELQY